MLQTGVARYVLLTQKVRTKIHLGIPSPVHPKYPKNVVTTSTRDIKLT